MLKSSTAAIKEVNARVLGSTGPSVAVFHPRTNRGSNDGRSICVQRRPTARDVRSMLRRPSNAKPFWSSSFHGEAFLTQFPSAHIASGLEDASAFAGYYHGHNHDATHQFILTGPTLQSHATCVFLVAIFASACPPPQTLCVRKFSKREE